MTTFQSPRSALRRGHSMRFLAAGTLAIVAALLCACGGGSSTSTSTATTTPPTDTAPAPDPGPGAAVPVAAAISTQPSPSSVTEGQSASSTVAASGDAPIAYQWLRNGTPISGATSASYTIATTTLADNGGLYSVTVSNAASAGAGVTSVAVALTVIALVGTEPGGGTTPTAATRYVEAWSSADAGAGLSLGVVDPDVPGTLIPVDTLPGASGELAGGRVGPYNTVLRVYGGTLDASTGVVSDQGIAQLVYVKGGAVYALRMAKGSGVPVPVRLSNESAAGSITLCGQDASGSDALICVAPSSGFSGMRYVRLSTPATSPPLAAPTYVFAGNGAAVAASLSTWFNDPATGQIAGYLWLGERAFLTDAGATVPFAITPVALGEGRLAHSLIAHGNGGLHRFDLASRTLTQVASGLTVPPGWGLSDASALYLHVTTASGGQVLVVPDAPGSAATALVSGGVAQASSNFRLLDDHLVFNADGGSGAATAVRKRDGAMQTLTLPAGGLVTFWEIGQYRASGNRLNYQRTEATAGNIVGSVLADGSGRQELGGLIDVMNGVPPSAAAHQLAASALTRSSARVLLRTPAGMAWLDRATGLAGPALGAALPQQFFGVPYTVMTPMLGSTGTAGFAANQTAADGRRIQALDAYFLGNEAGSLRRLTNHIP